MAFKHNIARNKVRHLRHQFPAATLSSRLIICVVVPHTHRYHSPKIWPNPKHHNGVVIFFQFRVCLLAAACLLAKLGRPTLDTKKGEKTKTASIT